MLYPTNCQCQELRGVFVVLYNQLDLCTKFQHLKIKPKIRNPNRNGPQRLAFASVYGVPLSMSLGSLQHACMRRLASNHHSQHVRSDPPVDKKQNALTRYSQPKNRHRGLRCVRGCGATSAFLYVCIGLRLNCRVRCDLLGR
jgi:hypothetical protein